MSQVAEMDFEDTPGARLRTALATIRTDVDQAFEQWLPVPDDTRAPLVEAMRHAAIGGGKRVCGGLGDQTSGVFEYNNASLMRGYPYYF